MKKLQNIFTIILAVLLLASCEKQELAYQADKVSDDKAQFQLFFMNPIAAVATNNINKVELNGQLLTNQTAPLNVSNFIPSGAVSKFYVTQAGNANLKLYQGAVNNMSLVFDQTVNLPAGKHQLFIHDFTKPPVILPYPMPFPTVTTERTGTTAWIRFYNFMYEAPGVPTTLKLQYQWQYTTDNATGAKSDWFNLGSPVSFGEATGWEPVTVNKTVEISSGTARIDYRIRLIGPNGEDMGSLKVGTAGTTDYSDWWNAQIGRIYNHVFAGYRTGTPAVGVKQSAAL